MPIKGDQKENAVKIAILGSGFIKPDIFQREVEQVMPQCDFSTGLLDWPGTARRADDEIQEYVGSFDAVIDLAADADALITDLAPVNQHILDRLPQLKFIGVARGGPVNVNIAAATRHGIPVINAPGRNGPAVAEYTLALLLSLARRVATGTATLARGDWQGDLYNYETTGLELMGHKAGLIGLGQVGKRVAELLQAFGMDVLVYDPFVDEATVSALGARQVDLESLLSQSDVVSLHARLTSETRGIIGRRELDLMKPDAYLINTARGPLLDYEALEAVLVEGKLAGVALDVYNREPPDPASALLQSPKVLAMPHVGGATRESAIRGARIVAVDLRRVLVDHLAPLHCKNPEVLSGASS
ncbi:MAG: 2-hydroxyacid dehydrogenase [Propionibacteriaceae bacterium]|jgi:D-3-phosphoglycerate dehydrogenase|nr:2-hydroxyacid dehydrogenase [Propionibacteriaceae bacterium]